MKIALGFVGRLVVAALVLPFDVMAQAGAATKVSTGEAGLVLTKNLYCGTKSLLEGNIGLMLGLLLVFIGIWGLVKGGKMAPAMVTILSGALLTALPSLTESAYQGLGSLLIETNLSKKGSQYAPPECRSAQQVRQDNFEQGYCTGGYLDCS